MAVAKLPTPARFVPLALPDAKEDKERRERGVSVEDWLDAPRPPEKRWMCEGNEAGCPALRCQYHLGRVGEAAGYSCEQQIAELPDGDDPTKPYGDRTLSLIGRVVGGKDGQRVVERDLENATRKLRALDDATLRQLGIPRRVIRELRRTRDNA